MDSNFKRKLFHRFLSTTACLVAVGAFAHEGQASPEGSLIVGGAAVVTQSGLETIVQQSTNRAIIKWNSFDVAQPEKVTFQQPSTNSITVNRITDSKASRIDGMVSANGKIVMINPNGIVFGATSQVDVGSLVATTSDMEDDIGFMAGAPAKFTKSGNPNASIINAGTITAKEAGLVGLVAPNVENSGVIQARLGKVQLASGDIHTIDLAGDGLIKLEVSDKVLSQSVKNTGTIQADGGEVLMTAAQGRAALDAIISNHGRIQTGKIFSTDGKVQKTGKVTLVAAHKDNGLSKIVQSGEISAEGGTVQIFGGYITLKATSKICTASDNGGGDVFIGGARQGANTLPRAQFLDVQAGSVINASALMQGNGGEVILWSDKHTDFGGTIISKGGSVSGNGGEVEVSGKGKLSYHGFVDLTANHGRTGNLLLDPTDILITSSPDTNMSGSSPFTPTIDDGPSVLDVATLTTALGSASVTVQTRATGSQAGNITVDAPITWMTGNTLTLDAHNNIIINQAMSGQSMTLIAGGDVQLNAALTGSGTLTILPAFDNQTIGLGNGSLGTLQLSITDLGNITNGWGQLIFGRTTSTALMDLTANTWNDNVLLRSDTGLIRITNTQTIGANNFSITSNSDIDLTAALVGTGTLTIASTTPSVGIGLGTGQTGAVSLSDTEMIFLTNGWGSLVFGSSLMSGDINVGALTWSDHVTFKTGTGTIAINGAQSMGSNNLTLESDSNPLINANLVGSGILTLLPGTASTSIGMGAGASGTYNIDAAEFARIQDGWSQIYVGRNDNTADMDLTALTWGDQVRFYSGSGIINVNGAQTYGNNLAVFQTDADIALNANLSGTGNIAFLSNLTTTSFGLAGEAGVINLTSAELDRILNGFGLIQFGSGVVPLNNAMAIGAYTWRDNVLFTNASAPVSFTGAQDFAANNLSVRTDGDPDFGAAITGTGTLTISSQTVSTGVGVGTGQAGAVSLNATDLGNITNGWSNIIIGRTDGTGAVNVGANTWNDNLTLQSGTGLMTIAGAQTMGSNNLTLTTGSDIAINGALNGTGTLTIQGDVAARTMGVGTGQPGTLSLNAADLGNITNGWTDIILGRTDGTGTMTVGANTWNDNLELRSNTGIINVAGVQNMGANTLTVSSGGDAQFNAALNGTGTLNLRGIAANTTLAIGTGQPGLFQLNATDLGNITNGWANIVIGRTDGTGAITAGARTWNDNLTYQSASGIITIAGIQTMGTNTLTISTDAASAINAALTGTGTLILQSNSANAAMGFGTGQPGAFQFDTTDISRITNGWANIVIGRTDGTGAITIGALTWNDNLTLQSLNAPIVIAGIQTLGANNVTFNTDGDPQINAAMNSTGVLTFQGLTNATTIGVGTGQAGTLSLSTADLNNADNTWAGIVIGRTTQTGAINAGNFTLADPLTLQSGTGVITIGAAINMGANNLAIQTDADLALNAGLTGTGTISITPMTSTTSIGIGTGQPGTINLTDAEQAHIINGWTNIVIGRVTGSGAITLGPALTWNDALFLRTTGPITINGNQTFGANNLSIQTDSDLTLNGNLSGSGAFGLTQIANTTSMGLGDAQAGTINLTNAELNRIVNGWSSLTFGLTTATADTNVGAYTWNDPLVLRSGAGIININGTQTMGANNLVFSTDSNLHIGGTLSGTGSLTIVPNLNTSIGLGTGQAGTIQLTDAELNNIANGWGSLVFGLATSTQPINVGAYTWNDSVTLRSGTGVITIAGAQNFGANNLSILTDANLALNGALTGTGTLSISPVGNTSMGIGDAQVGTLQLTNAELNNITNGWTSLILGSTTSTGAVNLGAYTWNDPLTVRNGTGLMTIAGTQNMGANNLSIQTDSNLALNGALTGTGILTIRGTANGTTTSLGTGQIGTLNLDNTEITQITNGWTRIDFGHVAATGTLNIGAATWNDPVRFITNTGVMTVNGAQNMGANNLEIYTNANPAFNALISGTGTLNILGATAATTMGIGDGQVGTIQLSNSDLAYLADGWDHIIFGYNGMTGAMNLGAYNWQYDTTFRTAAGIITVNGTQSTGSNNMTFETNANLAVNAALQGSGILTIRGSAVATTIGIGTGQAGALSLIDAELNQIADGWAEIIFGHSAATGAVNLGARTWNDPLHLISGTGVMTIGGIQNMGANDLILETNSNLAINAALNGTGDLTIKGASVGTTIGINGATGTLALSTADIANISNGWGSLTIGRQDMAGNISMAAATWQNPTTFLTRGNINVTGVQTSTETSGTSLVFVTQTGSFINTAGASAINPGGGRYLIYAVDVGTTTLGGLSPATTINAETYFSLPPSSVGTAGNVLIYSAGAAKVLLLQIDNKTKVYGDALPVFTYTYLGGLQGGDTLASVLTGYTLNAAGTSLTDNAGTTWAITGSFMTALGYTTNVIDGVLTVAQAPVFVQASPETRTYGAANPVFTINYIGLKNGETSAVFDTAAIASTLAGPTSNVGTYSITTSGASDTNYVFNYSANTLTITKANLTMTADNQTRQYGDANPALTISYSGFMNGEDFTVIDTMPTIGTTAISTTSPSVVPITLSGGTDNNYNLILVNGNLTITKADLAVTADNKTREYGDANPTLTYTFGPFKNGQTSAVLGTLPTISTLANVTTGVGTSAITLSGGSDTNYNYVFTHGVLTITRATVTATAQAASREYGDANPTFAVAYSGFKNGETFGVIDTLATASSVATPTTNVGTAVITATGAVDDNYDFVYVDGVLTITKANLAITADNQTREYGDANPTLTYTYGPFKNGENSGVLDSLPTISTTAIPTTAVGTSAITLTGGLDNNYNYVLTNGVLTITKATVTVTAQNDTREYGDANPTLSAVYTGFKNGENFGVIDTLATVTTPATPTTNVGTAVISAAGAADTNYDFVYVDGVLTITKATVTVTAQNDTREYGDANPTLSAVYTGFKNGENFGVIDTLATVTTPATPTTNVGTAVISAAGAADTNYDFVYVDGVLTITKATLTATADNQTRIYGDANPTLTITYTGFKNSENFGVIDTLATASTPAIPTTNVGTAVISATGAADSNYDFVYVDGVLTITKADLAITADNQTREYGDANPTLTYTFGPFKNGETSAVLGSLPTISTLATPTTNVGTAAITLSGGSDSNYNYVLTDGVLTITKADLAITADNQTREYGDANPTLTYTFGPFKNGETSVVLGSLPTISTLATPTTNVGTSAITLSGGSDSNYNYVLTDGVLTITKATLTATAQNASRQYGDANPTFAVAYTGFKNGETAGVIDTLATASSAAIATDNAGTTAVISATGANDGNYDFVYVDGVLTITKADLVITADDQTRIYGDANPTLTYTYGPFKNGETSAVLGSTPTISTTANLTTNAGTEAITLSGGSDSNYNYILNNGVLTITKAALIVQVDDATRAEGDPEPTFTYTVMSGLKNGDLASVLTGVSLTTPADKYTPFGTYAINGSGGTATNYYVSTFNPGTFTITPGKLPVRSLPSTVYYSNTMGVTKNWDKWRDLIYYEDDDYVETILFGRQIVKRQYHAAM